MGASLIVSIFLAFSLSLSWFSGDKENAMLEDTIQETKAEQAAINEQYRFLTVKMRDKEAGQKRLEAKLEREKKKQQKLKRNLAMAKRKMRIAVESGKAVDIEAERERIRKEVEERASKEIAKLENKIATIEKEKKRIEESARLGLTAKREKDGEAWTQAEIAKARAQDAILKYKALKTELEKVRAERNRADKVLREQAMARKKAEEALVRIKTEKADLEARLKAAEKTLQFTSSPDTEKSVKNNNAPLVAEMKKARDILRREIDIRNRTITELERNAKAIERSAKIIDNNEKQSLRSALEEKARKVAELERELENSRTREQALKASIKNGTTTARAAGDSVEKARIDTLRARILSLQAKLKETEENKKAFAEKARARIDALRKRTELLDTRNMEMEKDLKEGIPLKAKALPSKEQQDRELQTKLLGNGLIDLQSKASNYVAQKMIDRNVELEAQLQETRLQLAEAESTYRNARFGGYPDAMELTPGRGDTRAIVARYRKAATTITTLNQRNVELEARAGETARALAQAEAARYIIEQLQSQNLELQKKLREMDEAKRAEEAALTANAVPAAAGPLAAATQSPAMAPAPVNIEKKEAMPAEAVAVNVASPAVAVEAQNTDKADTAPAKSAAVSVNTEKKDTLPVALGEDVTANPSVVAFDFLASAAVEKTATASAEEPMMVASLEKGLDLESAMQSIIPKVSEPVASRPVVKSPAEKEAARKASAKALREIVNEIQDLNTSLETLQKGSGPERPTLVEIHEGLRKLKKKIINNVDSGVLSLEDIIPYTDANEEFTFYLIKKGETPDEIAGRKDVYGDPSMWPLIYKYNQSRLDKPDIIKTSRLLIIYKNLSPGEKEDAIKKARALGQWAKWKQEDKRAWIEDWIM